MGFIKSLWRGEVALSKTFWLYGVVMGLLLNMVFLSVCFMPEMPSDIVGAIFILIFVIPVVYNPFILIAIWRSANKYTGPSWYATCAKVVVLIGMGGYANALAEAVKAFLQ